MARVLLEDNGKQVQIAAFPSDKPVSVRVTGASPGNSAYISPHADSAIVIELSRPYHGAGA